MAILDDFLDMVQDSHPEMITFTEPCGAAAKTEEEKVEATLKSFFGDSDLVEEIKRLTFKKEEEEEKNEVETNARSFWSRALIQEIFDDRSEERVSEEHSNQLFRHA